MLIVNIFLLIDPEKAQLPYRDLAELANISLGSVGMIMQELIDLNFILKTKQTKKLKNTKGLLNRWITAYHNVLRPRLLKKQMRFINPDNYNRWKSINLEKISGSDRNIETAKLIFNNELQYIK